MKMTETERWNTALMIAINDLQNPNKKTRSVASEGEVTIEFMEIRQQLIEYAHTLLAFDSSSLD
jgi:hypothetical protein